MKAVIVSDSHGRYGGIQEIMEKEAPFDLFLHAGDLCGGYSRICEWTDAAVHAVRGNCDFGSDLPEEELVSFGRHTIFLTHGHRYYVRTGIEELARAAAVKGADLAVFGHTHMPLADERYGVIVLNPGSLSEPRQKPAKATYIVLETMPDGHVKWEIKYFE